jgi:hypothetical protein
MMKKTILPGLAVGALCFAYWLAGEKTAPTAKPTAQPTQTHASTEGGQSAMDPAKAAAPWPDSKDHQGVIAAIQAAAITYEVVKLPEIQPYLAHPDPVVRAAAMNGIVELGYPSGAQVLREAAARAATSEEAALLNAKADYLLLPSTYQLMKSKKFGLPMPANPAPK